MKKVFSILLFAVMVLAVAATCFATDISFAVHSEEETPYVYEEFNSNDSGDGSRFHDGYGYIIYEFPIEEGDTVAQLSWKIRNQYRVSVTNTDPDDTDSYDVILEAQKTAEEEANFTANWGDRGATVITVHDLSEYCKDNTTGKIWVMMSDADEDNGWGGFIYKEEPVRFYSGTEAAPEIEQPKTPDEMEAEALAALNIPEGVSAFFPNTQTEQKYLYLAGGAINGSFDRFMDGAGYSIYAFDVKASDTSALLHIALNNQWDLRVSNSDPDNIDGYTVLGVAEPTAEEAESGSVSWGERRVTDEDGNTTYPMYDFDLTEYLPGTDGKIYIYLGDVTPENGWGGMVCFGTPTYFAVNGATVDLGAAPAEEAPAEEAPAEEAPAEEAPAEEEVVEVAAPVEEEVVEAPAAPQTFDAAIIAAVAAVVSLAGYSVSKKH